MHRPLSPNKFVCVWFSGVFLCLQVHPPLSPAPSSPLQGSLHSNSSTHSAGQPQDDFVMIDFVSAPSHNKNTLIKICFSLQILRTM